MQKCGLFAQRFQQKMARIAFILIRKIRYNLGIISTKERLMDLIVFMLIAAMMTLVAVKVR
ncbi:hypothetical protein EGK14_06975 [Erwinia sp. 198]|nr:hypothetical protein EGK14_06975 [Erwinia sp. 198]